MGIGFVLCVSPKDADNVISSLKELGEEACQIGFIKAGGEGVCLK